jgi:hypothetical protein
MDAMHGLEELRKVRGVREVTHVTTYGCFRETAHGDTRELRVEIVDGGPGAGALRYTAIVTSDDGRRATGNPSRNSTWRWRWSTGRTSTRTKAPCE